MASFCVDWEYLYTLLCIPSLRWWHIMVKLHALPISLEVDLWSDLWNKALLSFSLKVLMIRFHPFDPPVLFIRQSLDIWPSFSQSKHRLFLSLDHSYRSVFTAARRHDGANFPWSSIGGLHVCLMVFSNVFCYPMKGVVTSAPVALSPFSELTDAFIAE